MKFYKPIFSIVIIWIQLIFSIKSYNELQSWIEANPKLLETITLIREYETLFLFVLIIGVYEMTTKPSWFKNFVRFFLVCIVFGYEFSRFIPIEGFSSGVYNTAWFSAVLAVVLILFRIVLKIFKKIKPKKF